MYNYWLKLFVTLAVTIKAFHHLEFQRRFWGIFLSYAPKNVFMCPQGNLYQQIDSIAMGSPLEPTFANFYLGILENIVLNNLDKKPLIYCQYFLGVFFFNIHKKIN